MTMLENEILGDFKLFYENNDEYRKKVDNVSELFGLKEKSRLRNDYLPTYIVGNYADKKEKYAIISLNPGFKECQNKEEEKMKQGTIDNYQNFVLNFFKLIQKLEYTEDNKVKKFNSSYYTKFRPYISELVNKEITKENQYDVYFEHLLNIDIVPYHSEKFPSSNLNEEAKIKYLNERMNSILEFINDNKNIKGVIFNGASHFGIVKAIYPDIAVKTVKINDYNDVRLFTLDGVRCIQHSFINRPNSHLSNDNIKAIADTFLDYLSV